ncbi:hypothetical protein [Phascolarctobacterium sp.]|uniref:DNA-3-methyladenine glycosylase family protein n=1 Tax=Phascolarctobacterium sp. TaxID=2049039 RepID=UPI003077092F
MLKTPDWAAGAEYLREHAPELIPLIDRFPVCELKPEPESKYFGTLVTGIVSQQLPPDVSLQLLKKLGELLGTPLTPQAVMDVSVEALCEKGLVLQKAEYLKNFAEAAVSGSITIEKFTEMTDSEITKQLMQVRGLGQWTIEMFLLLALCRTDVMPSADFIFKKGLQELRGLKDIPKRAQITTLTVKWRPWRSLGVWYLWQEAAFRDEQKRIQQKTK